MNPSRPSSRRAREPHAHSPADARYSTTNASPEVNVSLDPKTNGIKLSVIWGPSSEPHTKQWQWQLCGTPENMTLVPVIDDDVHTSLKGRHGHSPVVSSTEANMPTRTVPATQRYHSLDDSWQRRHLDTSRSRQTEEGYLHPEESGQYHPKREQPRVHFSKRLHRVRHEDSARPRVHSARYNHEPCSIVQSEHLSRRATESDPQPRSSVIMELPIRDKYEEPKHHTSSRRKERRTEHSPDAREHRSREKRDGHGRERTSSREKRRANHDW